MDFEQDQSLSGLTDLQAKENFKKYGPNILDSDKKYNPFKTLLATLKEPMLLLLIASSLIYLFVGELKEALALSISMLIVIGITFYQENKTEKTLQALKQLSSPRAVVLRSGQLKRIPGPEIVPADLLVLSEGDRVSADSKIIKANSLLVDESLLTGESASVIKNVDDTAFSGSIVLRGDAIALVQSTGANTQIGQIGKSIKSIEFLDSLLKKETRSIVKAMSVFALITCTSVVVLEYSKSFNIIQALLRGITTAMSMIPEEFPVILTIFLSLGAWRLSQHNVLTRRLDIIETLGAITTLCVDKTGTITQNIMKITDFINWGDFTKQNLITAAFYAGKELPIDPMEIEIKNQFTTITGENDHKMELFKEYSITPEITAVTKIYKKGPSYSIFSKGAPETILKLTNHPNTQDVLNKTEELAKSGKRILGVAMSENQYFTDIPETPTNLHLVFMGLLAFEDPIKDGVKESVNECYEAGIDILMLTGDHPTTATNIATQVGLKNSSSVMLGNEIETSTK